MAICKYCGTEITWFKEKKKFIPIEQNGEVHECEEYKKSKKTAKVIKVSDLSAEEIARYENNINKKNKR